MRSRLFEPGPRHVHRARRHEKIYTRTHSGTHACSSPLRVLSTFSPDGATLASGSGDFTVRLLDTAPLEVRYRARREAEALRPEAELLVASLWRQEHAPAEVVDALRADRELSTPLRQAALRAVLRRAQPPEAATGDLHDTP